MTHRHDNKRKILLLGDARQVHIKRLSVGLVERGYRVLTTSLEPVDDIPGERAPIEISRWLPNVVRYPMAVPRVTSILRSFAPDLINAHFVPNYGLIAALSRFTPWVLSTWGSDVMILPRRSPFHAFRTRYVVKRATFITSDARVMTERLVELGADPARILTVPFGIDRRAFYPPDDSSEVAGPRLLSNRKLEPVYNVAAIIAAFRTLRESVDHATLTIIGGGSLEKKLRDDARQGRFSGSIHFLGPTPHEAMPRILRSHDIYISVAFSDTTSVSLLEAMACGLFPVVSDIPANREWIDHGVNGFLVPLGQPAALERAIVDAWRDRPLRRAAAQRNTERIEKRGDWNITMAEVTALFHRLISTD